MNRIDNSHVENLIQDHKSKKMFSEFKIRQIQLFFLAIFLGFITVFSLYLMSDISKISGYEITGNYYISDQEIDSYINIDHDTRKLFLFEDLILKNILNHELVENASLQVDSRGFVSIQIVEKKLIGYQYLDEGELLVGDGQIIEMTENNVDLISKLPYVVGFQVTLDPPVKPKKDAEDKEIKEYEIHKEIYDTQVMNHKLFLREFSKMDAEIIAQISEIQQYEFSWSEYGVLCIMKDGNYIYTELDGVHKINNYNGFASYLSDSKNCIYINDMTLIPHVGLCPEEEDALELEEELAQENGENSSETEENSENE